MIRAIRARQKTRSHWCLLRIERFKIEYLRVFRLDALASKRMLERLRDFSRPRSTQLQPEPTPEARS